MNEITRQRVIMMLKILLSRIDDKLQGERDNRTVIDKVRPKETEFALKTAIKLLEPEKDDFFRKGE